MKKDLILLHGALGSRRQFDDMIPALSGSYRIIAPDLSGHGQRTSDAGFTIRSMADNLLEQLRDSDLNEPDIFGYSMGGYVALFIAAENLFPVRNIITYGTRFDWSEDYTDQQQKMLDPEKMTQKVPAYAQHLATLHGKDHWKGVVRQTAAMMQDLGRSPLLSQKALGLIENNVWVTRGSEDNMVTAEESLKAAGQLQNGEYIEIGQQPHPIEKVDISAIVQLIQAGFPS